MIVLAKRNRLLYKEQSIQLLKNLSMESKEKDKAEGEASCFKQNLCWIVSFTTVLLFFLGSVAAFHNAKNSRIVKLKGLS